MSPKMGRPPKAITKDIKLQIRITQETSNTLKQCAEALGIPRTAVIEKGIEMVAQEIKKEE